ncbi:pentaheme c-type cytochrome TorC [Photobacterium kishitanii]|uniref:Cytochrome c-type protein n=1 Tax=Photobacterium kishitanii TaxID=318456 RepID=A0AAX0Z1L6_9GAMM|nr:pentaheme c-type cytochrome TorC [Photobacterium kishitanii]KJG11424.1 nitrate reductase [Photobacterium kishitanii]KJG56706.1 nitrate reductase [Photobacterium kishitanii]KJG62521.1 nitrate reductase [Photobacterium kishitanii]KJG66889.1 nitrate reductase [Photobacterium kishitanii]KJG70771.1 nitrate reductase [Photobacterium kishitanii]
MLTFIKKIWLTFWRPAAKISLGVLTLGGFISGIIFWGGFNTALEVANTEKFCISCHSMRDTVYPELQGTIHWENNAGVRATCPDCHVPHNWTDKIARKMQASKEVFGAIVGTIDTPAKFEAKRLELAQHEWKRFAANKSLECKSCHSYSSMKWDEMSPRAQVQMKQAAAKDQSCIDCHKGIAHHLPANMDSSGGMISELATVAQNTDYEKGNTYYSMQFIPMFEDEAKTQDGGSLEPASAVKVVAVKDDMLQIEISGWRKEKGFGRVINQDFGMNIPTAALSKTAAQNNKIVTGTTEKEDDVTGLKWQQVSAILWVEKAKFVSNINDIWSVAQSAYKTNCSVCHTQPAENHFDANTWPGMFNGMLAFVNFDTDSEAIVLKYLQNHSSDFAKEKH